MFSIRFDTGFAVATYAKLDSVNVNGGCKCE